MSRETGDRFADILAAIKRCEQYQGHLEDSNELFARMAYDAILRNLAVIGEAVRSLPPDIKAGEPAAPWPSIAGLRNIVVHEYFRIDRALIAEIVSDELAPLTEIIERLSQSAPDGPATSQ